MDNSLGNTIKYRRFQMEVSQTDLSRLSGVDRTTLNRIENGVIKKPKVKTLVKIARVIGIPLARLMYESGYNYKEIGETISMKKSIFNRKKLKDYCVEYSLVFDGEFLVGAYDEEDANTKLINFMNDIFKEVSKTNPAFKNFYETSDLDFNSRAYEVIVKR